MTDLVISQPSPLLRPFRDSAIVAYRNVLTIARVPTLLMTATVQPLMFVFLFAYVFGASLGGSAYREFLLAGIFTQTVAFNAAFTTVGLANDLHKGIIDRFRSLPCHEWPCCSVARCPICWSASSACSSW